MSDDNIKKWTKIVEESQGKLRADVANAIPTMFVVPSLSNQDPYKQYRLGLAIASARAKEQGLIDDTKKESAFSEYMTLIAQTEEAKRTLELAFKMMGVTDAKTINYPGSYEAPDVNTASPVAKFKPTKKSRD